MFAKLFRHGIWVIPFLAGLAAALVLLIIPQTKNVGSVFRYDFSVPILIFIFFILGSTYLPEIIGKPLQFCLFMMIWVMPLVGLWGTANSEPGIIAGMLPTSDASGYFSDALRVLNGGFLSSFSGKRPIFSLFLAVIFSMTNYQIQWTQVILVILNGISAYLLMKEFEQNFGKIPSVLGALIIFIYYRRFAGLILTEHIGLLFGLTGFWLLLRAAKEQKCVLYASGVWIISIGLVARAGAFVVLPMLLVWGGFLFKQQALKIKAAILSSTIILVMLSFGINLLMDKIYADDDSQTFSNFSYTFYGLTQGGSGWTSIFDDHPEVLKLNNTEMADAIYGLAFKSICEHPEKLFLGIYQSYIDFLDIRGKSCVYCFFSSGDVAIYANGKTSDTGMNLTAKVSLYLLALVGIISSVYKRKDSIYSLSLLCLAGIFLSVPFVPPGDADRMRVYAVTIPMLAFVVVSGAHNILVWIKVKNYLTNPMEELPVKIGLVWAGFLILFCFFSPIFLVKLLAQSIAVPKLTCPPSETGVFINYQKGSTITVLPGQRIAPGLYPSISYGQFIRSIHNYDEILLTKELSDINPPQTLTRTIDLLSGQETLLMVSPDLLPTHNGLIAFCGNWASTEGLQNHSIFYGKEIVETTK